MMRILVVCLAVLMVGQAEAKNCSLPGESSPLMDTVLSAAQMAEGQAMADAVVPLDRYGNPGTPLGPMYQIVNGVATPIYANWAGPKVAFGNLSNSNKRNIFDVIEQLLVLGVPDLGLPPILPDVALVNLGGSKQGVMQWDQLSDTGWQNGLSELRNKKFGPPGHVIGTVPYPEMRGVSFGLTMVQPTVNGFTTQAQLDAIQALGRQFFPNAIQVLEDMNYAGWVTGTTPLITEPSVHHEHTLFYNQAMNAAPTPGRFTDAFAFHAVSLLCEPDYMSDGVHPSASGNLKDARAWVVWAWNHPVLHKILWGPR